MKNRVQGKIRLIAFAVISILTVAVAVTVLVHSPRNDSVRIGYLPIAASAPLFVAEYLDRFEAAGVEIELIEFRSSNELAIAASAGRIDVLVTCATNTALDAMATTGVNLKIFQTNGYRGASEGKPTDYLLGTPGTTIEDLRGKPVAFFPGSVSRVFANLVLPRFGISIDDIQYVEMGPGEWLPAIQSGRIRGVVAVEPFATMILMSGAGEVLIEGYVSQVLPSAPLSGSWFVDGALTDEQERKIVDILSAAAESIRDNPAGSAAAISRYTGIDIAVAEMIGLNDWRLSSDAAARESLLAFVAILEEHEAIIKKPPQPESWIWHYLN